MAEQDDQHGGAPAPASDQEWLQNYLNENQGQVEAGTRVNPPQKKGPSILPLLGGAFVLAAVVAGLFLYKTQRDAAKYKEAPGDLGQAVVVASGLRGHLIAQLKDDKTVHYQLKIEPIDFPEQDSFARAVASNSAPFHFNLRVLNQVGDSICGKQIVLPAVPAGPVPAGADALQRVKGSKGIFAGLWAEGTLPCSPEQYARFNYWDFSTDFPSVVDQDRAFGIDHRPQTDNPDGAGTQQQSAQGSRPASRARRRAAPKKPQAVYFLQGDDHVSSFEPGRNLLTLGPGRSFVVLRAADLATARAWADDDALVHYTCDPQATCSLRRSGSAAIILARRSN